jgi:phosphoglycolate phosphatase-like HAD superfamily hydrolase
MIKILASDFDGVICNGLLEYFASSKKAYNQIWDNKILVNNDLAESFYFLRPVIETGWEMPILLRALVLNFSSEEILNQWHTVCQEIIDKEKLNPQIIAKTLDTIRAKWIKNNLEDWLNLHSFYEGVILRLKQFIDSGIKIYIITTKEGIFTKKLLDQQGIILPQEAIIGKEKQCPKYETLRQIIKENNVKPSEIFFIEDRLPALELVQQQSDLKEISLFLASWGYNTERTRNSIKSNSAIKLLSLSQFRQDILQWNCT